MTKLSQSIEKIGLVFIHGAGLHSDIWSRVSDGLAQPYLCIQFPYSTDKIAPRQKLSLKDYLSEISRQVEAWEVQRFIIVAHSIGGVLALKLTEEMGDRVVGLAAVGAVIPAGGGSFLSVYPPLKRIMMPLILRLFGTKPPESAIRRALCNDLTPEQADRIVRKFAQEAVRIYTDRVNAPVPRVPSLYIKLGQDQELSPLLQEQMIRNLGAAQVVSLESGHLPMLSQPVELRKILQKFASGIHA